MSECALLFLHFSDSIRTASIKWLSFKTISSLHKRSAAACGRCQLEVRDTLFPLLSDQISLSFRFLFLFFLPFWHTIEIQLNLAAPEKFEGFLCRYPVLGSKPIHFLWRRWVHSLTVLNYAVGLRLCKDYGMIQRWIGLWSKVVIEFGSWYPSEWRMESGEWFAPFFFPPWCETKYIHYWRDCVHIKSLPSQRPSHVGV